MASEPEPEPPVPQAATADKSPLVCAPCWICLEDGPDDAGEPLIRDCACRGETSAGYHLTCITKYATTKLDKLLSDESNKDVPFSMADLYRSSFGKDWQDCPNCCQLYNKPVLQLMGKAFVQFTNDRNLPKTHFVWFKAQIFNIETLLYGAQSKKDHADARDQIEFLLQFVQEEYATLAAEW